MSINIRVDNKNLVLDEPITFYELAKKYQDKYDDDILLVYVNHNVFELHNKCKSGDNISFLFYKDIEGYEAYARTGLYILYKAIVDVMSEADDYPVLRFTQNHGFYVDSHIGYVYTYDDVEKIKKRYQEIVDSKIQIKKYTMSTPSAMQFAKVMNFHSRELILKYRLKGTTNYYMLDNLYDYFYDQLLYDTGYIKLYNIEKYKDGIIITFPNIKDSSKPVEFNPIDKMFDVQYEGLKWSESLKVNTVGLLNEKIATGEFDDLIIMQESYQAAKIANIANEIVDSKKKLVFIAGPSSSGKTTFSHRLSYSMKALGLNPHPISVDNFFVDREFSPRDENGDYDYEKLECVDIEFFNDTMLKLLSGDLVEMPRYNFINGKREFKGDYKQLHSDDILIVEGIHCLNPKMSYKLDHSDKFNIYISALTQICIDEHNRIPTTDARLLRRIVRDNRTRGCSAIDTIKMWPNVRKGEEEYIFPYQNNADVMFNSALVYEMPILKTYVEPLLFNIDRDTPEFHIAERLLKFLSFMLGGLERTVPKYSILREFIGGSILDVG